NTGKGNVANSLLHFGQRYYDPTTGRWTQQDPEDRLGSATRGDRFLFADDNPVDESDPSGRLSLGEAWEYVESSAETAYDHPEDAVACSTLVYASGVCEEWVTPEEAE
ncbi:MAG TPA: RHS repeat-associated core domain-containing protein, partial [Solirubrobacteraceae bacterium]